MYFLEGKLRLISSEPFVFRFTCMQMQIQIQIPYYRSHTTDKEKTCKTTYHGSNSWIMLSKRITANKRDANPEIQANTSTANVIKLLQPIACRLFIKLFELFIVDCIPYDHQWLLRWWENNAKTKDNKKTMRINAAVMLTKRF